VDPPVDIGSLNLRSAGIRMAPISLPLLPHFCPCLAAFVHAKLLKHLKGLIQERTFGPDVAGSLSTQSISLKSSALAHGF